MAAEEVCFDEKLLFTEFEGEQAKKQTERVINDSTRKPSSKLLQEENVRLKKVLKTLVSLLTCATQEGRSNEEAFSPLFQGIYFDNRTSIRNREKVEEFVQSLQSYPASSDERESFGRENLPPSVFDLNYEIGKISEDASSFRSSFPVISSVQYYEEYCVDCTGLPLVDFNPRVTDGWTIPKYEQIFFNVLPCGEETPKVKIRQARTCFNCGNGGHNVQDCPEPQDPAKISANRKEFLNKFSSPVNSKSPRYHFDESQEKRFGGFKPGIISEKLKEALGLGKEDLPLYVYRMRALGYPPGYLPSKSKPSLLLYGADGNVDDYVVEEEGSKDSDTSIRGSFVEYPGFNTALPEGVRDISAKLGMPAMGLHQHVDNLAALYTHMKGLPSRTASHQNDRKRKRPEADRVEEDMEVVEDGGRSASLELGAAASSTMAPAKRRKYDDENDSSDGDRTGYSPAHPGVQCGSQELELLKLYRKCPGNDVSSQALSDANLDPFVIGSEVGGTSADLSTGKGKRKSSRESLEDGEVVSDEEQQIEEVEAEDVFPEPTLGWWLREPLDPVSTAQPKLSPPPKPTVQLPMEALSRFYTNSTVLQKMSFEDRVMWLDPIYGNFQPVSGRYEKLRKILGKKSVHK